MAVKGDFNQTDCWYIYDALTGGASGLATEATLSTVDSNVFLLCERIIGGSASPSVFKDPADDVSWFSKMTTVALASTLTEVTGNAANGAAVQVAIAASYAANPAKKLVSKIIVWNGATYDWFLTYSG